jgi:hypothetical protein
VDDRRGESARTKLAAILGGSGAIVLGLLYATYALGPTVVEASMWGTVTFFAGLAIIIGALGLSTAGGAALLMGLTAWMALTSALQVLAIGTLLLTDGPWLADLAAYRFPGAPWALILLHVIVTTFCFVACLRLAPWRRHKEAGELLGETA